MVLKEAISMICIVCLLISCQENHEAKESENTVQRSKDVTSETINEQDLPSKNKKQSSEFQIADYKYNNDSLEEVTSLEGNLNEDSLMERVVVFNTLRTGDFGKEREIHILKQEDKVWKLWKKVKGAVLPDEHGGMMGDPFSDKEIRIERNTIVIGHFGGSREKWHYTHRYRYQNNDFYLIGATVNYGAPCDFFEKLDYNLSTGKVVYDKVIENCEEGIEEMKEKSFFLKREQLPFMIGFYPGENEVEIPDLNTSMYY